jgi:hypothetical protein
MHSLRLQRWQERVRVVEKYLLPPTACGGAVAVHAALRTACSKCVMCAMHTVHFCVRTK